MRLAIATIDRLRAYDMYISRFHDSSAIAAPGRHVAISASTVRGHILFREFVGIAGLRSGSAERKSRCVNRWHVVQRQRVGSRVRFRIAGRFNSETQQWSYRGCSGSNNAKGSFESALSISCCTMNKNARISSRRSLHCPCKKWH